MALSHFLYTVSVILILVASILYYTKNYWANLLPRHFRDRLGHYIPLPSFEHDIEAGLTSTDFDLSQNLEDGDDRFGLDAASRREIKRIIKSKKCNFDQARLIFLQDKMRKAGIDPQTGLPLDSKFVSFS